MVVVDSYVVAVGMCVVTMMCWGSWANTQKLATREWPFQLFYWDYAIGTVVLSLALAFTMGSFGSAGRPFLADFAQADGNALLLALLGGVVFNLANILLVAAIDIAGLAVAFPVGIGLALVIGVVINYVATPLGHPLILFAGVGAIIVAILLDAAAYRRLSSSGHTQTREGIAISVVAGLLMGLFYRLVAASMSAEFARLEPGRLSPYTAVVVFAAGVFVSTFLWNSLAMVRPLSGPPVAFADYFRKGSLRLHAVGVLGGVIWCTGMSFSIIASGAAGFAVSYALGQGATLVAALWGVFVWQEFRHAASRTSALLAWMFALYVLGLALIVLSRVVS